MKKLTLTGKYGTGKYALIDDEWYPIVYWFNWYVNEGYPMMADKNGKPIYLHRLVCGTRKGLLTDHINGDRLDNRRANLRHATMQQNQYNKPRRVDSTTGYKGVKLDKRIGRWCAYITINGKLRSLGSYKTPQEASGAYKKAAKELHGEFYYQEK